MKKPIELTDDEFTKLAIAVAGLPFIRPTKWETDYLEDVMHTVLNFHIQEPVVINALNFFQLQVQQQHRINNHYRLKALLAKFPNDKDGNEAAALFLWSNRHWTRIELLRRLLDFFESIGVTDQLSLHAWIKTATFEADFKGKVKGLGIAVWEWLRIRCGIDALKPDVWVINFAKRVVGKRLSEKVLVDTFGRIAPMAGESLSTLDVTIWYYEKMAMATKDCPELRLIAWNLLKAKLEEKLREEVLMSDFNWQFIIDDRHKLRYESAGMSIRPDRSLFGETVPGTTTATIRQSVWTEGLELEMMIRHDTSLPLPLFGQLKETLAEQGWEAANDTHFTASLDFEEDMIMTPAMSYGELAEWVAQVVGVAVKGLRSSRHYD